MGTGWRKQLCPCLCLLQTLMYLAVHLSFWELVKFVDFLTGQALKYNFYIVFYLCQLGTKNAVARKVYLFNRPIDQNPTNQVMPRFFSNFILKRLYEPVADPEFLSR